MKIQTLTTDLIDRLANDLERQLHVHDVLTMEEFLASQRLEISEDLLIALLPVELEFRSRHQAAFSEDEFRLRFPQYASVVNAILDHWRHHHVHQLEQTIVPQVSPQLQETCIRSAHSAMASLVTASRLSLILTSGLVAGTQFSLNVGASAVAGRSKSVAIFVGDDREASREHCRFEMTASGGYVEDLGSRNGTLLNGQHIGRALLQDGDVVSVGLSMLTIRYSHHSEIYEPETAPGSVGGLADATTALLPREVGPYEITGVIGKGGMGVVYSALHRKTKEALAIKLVLPHLNTTPQALQIFLREASILTGLKHSRIVASREFGLHENRPYFVMEYVPSVDLETILATQSPQRRIRIVCKSICKVLEGLQYAHEQGIVHRDIKPSNILVFWTGQKLNCKLADFGLAKRFDDAGMSGLTGENEIRGTLAYMPPEQLKDSRSAGRAADIYATGVCLFRFLAGVLPYRQTEGEALMRCVIQHDVRPLSELLPDCPSTLEQIVTRAMQVRPGDRFESAAAMLNDLAEFVNRMK